MPINADKIHTWKADIERSIDFYNDWFLRFAPETFRTQRSQTTTVVLKAFSKTENLTKITPEVLRLDPGLLPILRMVTAPPLARDRLMGLAHVSKSFIDALEGRENSPSRLPSKMPDRELLESLQRLCDVLSELIDTDLIPWFASKESPSSEEVDRAATVIADRHCGASTDPIIRNAQEKRQLGTLERWFKNYGYREIGTRDARDPWSMPPGTFAFRVSLPAGSDRSPVQIPIDCIVKAVSSTYAEFPILIEAKSAGDVTNTNKRRKEEAQKYRQLQEKYGSSVNFVLYLCGYFETGYLGYEAAEGIDWIWEHRTNDFASLLAPRTPLEPQVTRDNTEVYAVHDRSGREDSRFFAQSQEDARKSGQERNRLGQFSTPFSIARGMVAQALQWLPEDAPINFLEPAIGSGVFVSALLHEVEPQRIASTVGCEIDPAYGEIARTLWESSGLRVVMGDFVGFSSDPSNFGKFSLLCTNPPYVRHHHLTADQKVNLQGEVNRRLGLHVSGLSGLYVYFILLADALLAEGAIASWLLPAEFLYVNYGRALRDYLTSRVTLLSIHHFDPDEVQFDDALVSSCIVTYRKTAPLSDAMCKMSFGSDFSAPKQERWMRLSDLRTLNKWTMMHFGEAKDPNRVRLGDLFTVRRGIATGANDFFIIDNDTALKHEIPSVFLKPILLSPRHIRDLVIESGINGLPDIDGHGFLIDCNLPPEEVREQYPGLWAYLQEGMKKGIPDRYLCSQREVWYFQEKRAPSPFLASYMGRTNDQRRCPIRFFVNFSSAIVTNVFLNLYPTPELRQCLHNRDRMLELGDHLNSIPPESVFQAGRVYGGGLHKIEPKELLDVPLGIAPDWLKAAVKRQLLLL